MPRLNFKALFTLARCVCVFREIMSVPNHKIENNALGPRSMHQILNLMAH